MARLNPTGDPSAALRDGLYIPHPHATGTRIAARLEIEPASTHLVAGGTGSGKTTELLVAHQALSHVPDMTPIFVDVPSTQQIDKLARGVLIALTASRVAEVLLQSSD